MGRNRRSRSRSRSGGSEGAPKVRKRPPRKKKVAADSAWPWNFAKELVGKDGTVNYLAFGSNLSQQKMKGRKVKWLSVRRASVSGWRLAFNQVGFPPLEPCFANVEPLAPEAVSATQPMLHGLVYKMSPDMFNQLVLQEGDHGWYDILRVKAKICECRLEASVR